MTVAWTFIRAGIRHSKWPLPALIARANWVISCVVPPPLTEGVCAAAAAAGNASPAATNNTVITMRKSRIAPPSFRLLPLIRHLEDLDECLIDGASHRTLNPQNDASTVKGSSGKDCYLGPLPPASDGEAVTTPPSRPGNAPNAAITPARLMAITPSAPPRGGPVPGISSSRRSRRGGQNQPCPPYHSVGGNVNTLYQRGPRSELAHLVHTGSIVDRVEGLTEVVGDGVGGGEDVVAGLDPNGAVAAGGLHELAD